MRITLALPTVEPLGPLGDWDLYEACIAELVATSGSLASHDRTLLGTRLAIAHSAPAPEHPLVKDLWRERKSLRQFGLLTVSADLGQFAAKFRTDLTASNPTCSQSDADSLVESYGAHNLLFEVSNLLLLANILRPGALSTVQGFAFAEDRFIEDVPAFFAEDWERARGASQKYSWPPLLDLSIAQAWDWLAATGSIEDGIGRRPIGRALASLSHIASRSLNSDSSMNLAWILLGLETLYCSGNVGLREQLVSKSELVLGPRTENKKAFGAMYDFRSRLLHGDMDLPLRYSMFNAVPDYERHYDDLGDYEGLGLAALIGTVQVMIKNNWSGLAFQHALTGISTSSTGAAA